MGPPTLWARVEPPRLPSGNGCSCSRPTAPAAQLPWSRPGLPAAAAWPLRGASQRASIGRESSTRQRLTCVAALHAGSLGPALTATAGQAGCLPPAGGRCWRTISGQDLMLEGSVSRVPVSARRVRADSEGCRDREQSGQQRQCLCCARRLPARVLLAWPASQLAAADTA